MGLTGDHRKPINTRMKTRGQKSEKPVASCSSVIQKTRRLPLHYDFRLEQPGVAEERGRTQGPRISTCQQGGDAGSKDHPLEYGGFEGIIPEGEYGGGHE